MLGGEGNNESFCEYIASEFRLVFVLSVVPVHSQNADEEVEKDV